MSIDDLPARRPMYCLAALLLAVSPAWAAYSCNVSAPSMGVLYSATTAQQAIGLVTLSCTRGVLNNSTLPYDIMASSGNNPRPAEPHRRVRLGATNNYLVYTLRRGIDSNLNCNNIKNIWREPPSTEFMTGTLSFGASLTASKTHQFCMYLPGTSDNPAAPAAGIYTDTFNIYARYPATTGALSPLVPVTYTVGVNNQCVFHTFPQGMVFNYTSFSTAQTRQSTFNLRCSNALPWTVSVSPVSATLVGLTYTLAPSPASGAGTGNNQLITLTGTIAANQAGTCATASCSGSRVHTVTITY